MIDITLAGGACPARPLTHALPRAMMYPHAPYDVPLENCDFAVTAFRGDVRELVPLFVQTVVNTGRPYLVADFEVAAPSVCRSLCLFMQVQEGIMVGKVEPCIVRPGAPMILVTADRTRAFTMSGDGKLVDCAVPRPNRAKRGIARGWAELIRRMNASVTETGAFRHASWEVHLSPLAAAAAFA
jgi:hypothetical protein